MIDPVAWTFTIWLALMIWVLIISISDLPRRQRDTCKKHPATAYCSHRKNLPKGKM